MSIPNNIAFARVDCTGNEQKYVTEVLESGWLTTASKTHTFEDRFKEYVNCKHALAVNSCTSGMHLALDALGIGRGDKVFVPSLTFTSTAEVIRYMGADPVVLDVDYDTAGLNTHILKEAIRKYPEVNTLMAVHYGGLALPMESAESDGIIDICRDAGVKVIEDAAHALPTVHNGKLVGSFGDITCFSFYANKTMTTGEGGMVTTDNDDYADRIRLMRLHGINRDAWDRYITAGCSWEYDVVAPGYKYNMPDLNAAVGLAQFERLLELHAGRVRCAKKYFERLHEIPNIDLPFKPDNMDNHSWHLFPIKIKPGARVSRNAVIEHLFEAGIGTSVHYKPLHRLAYYRDHYSLASEDFPAAEAIWQSTLSLPIYNLLTDEEIDFVCDTLASVDL